MDLMNIQWAYRAKQYYRMLPAEIYALTLPYHFHLSTEEFKAIVEAPNVEEMKKQIENTYYGTHVHMKEGQSIEKSIKDILRDLYISDRQKDPYSDDARIFILEGAGNRQADDSVRVYPLWTDQTGDIDILGR